MRILLRISYFGEGFYGVARQPGLRTVEGEVRRILKDAGVRVGRSIISSRTDRGVSALTNYLAVDVDKVPPIGAFFEVPDLFVLGITRVKDNFDPRREARLRWYRYVFPERLDIRRAREAGKLFEGIHDFVSFCIPEGRKTVRVVKRVSIFNAGGVTFMDVFAQSFLRQQVRRMAYAVFMVGTGEWGLEEVRRRLEERDPVPPMPPDFLLLVDVRMPLGVPLDEAAVKRWKKAWKKREMELRAKRVIFSTLP